MDLWVNGFNFEARFLYGFYDLLFADARRVYGEQLARVFGVDLPVADAFCLIEVRLHGGYAASAVDIGFELK